MAWSTFSNGSSLDCLEVDTVGAFYDNGCCPENDHVDNAADNDEVKHKCLFYQAFKVYLKDSCSRDIGLPPPVLLGDGRELDMYSLFSLVKKRGGYARVSKEGLWGDVTKELGLNLEGFASVKLVYDKHLNGFERWLRKTFEEKNLKNEDHEIDWGLKSFLLDLEKGFRSLLCPKLKDNDNNDEPVEFESNKRRKHIDLVNPKNDTKLLDTKNQNDIPKDVQLVNGDDDEKFCIGVKDDPATLDAKGAEKAFSSRKRKRESLSSMLDWMKHVAKHPLVPLAQPIPKPSKWKEYKGDDFLGQVLWAREVRSRRPPVEPNSGLSSMQKLKMHPTMFEDHVAHGHHAPVKLRCSERQPSSVKPRFCPCCNPCPPNGNRPASSPIVEGERCRMEKTTEIPDLLTTKSIADPSGDDALEKQVFVGPLYQAEIPEWTGVVSESDSKWLGTKIWPSNSEPAAEANLVGRGRQEKCSCNFPGSVECIRFHIAESRMKLKHELGSVFYHWGFNRMGEEVSLRWTAEEEKRFKDIMRSDIPSRNKSFWNNPSKYFPKKTRRDVVNYYFNAYVIQRRIYQNRVTPKNVDSDDDEEAEFGSFGDGFGMEHVKGPGNDFLECSENKQCTDYDLE
ncbi:hypothetical protein RJT34_02905 [Clitoria ternatea]|uniref:ARID domain-containing protein n=1 Tax=Clitoria ternatea TaxID=43366 RepID=A0AAN9KKQ0_CLITE